MTDQYTASDWTPGVDPVNPELEEPLTVAVFEAIGGASRCWSEPPGGVFNDREAARIAYGLIDWIEKFYQGGGAT